MKNEIQILVVDDNQENLKLVGNFLKEKGYKIALSTDGENALKILNNNRIDLILLDIMMPGMDGFELCAKIKAENDLKNIPVIFLTARTDTDDIVKGFELGGVDYLTKPFRKEELYVRVNNHIQLKLLRDLHEKYLKEYKESRNTALSMLLEFSKIIDPD
ncbi:response regulator [Alkaliflexus imshenetskii]|uniref:response regulator n=1 Tax=Alkaliflexus imshenetskii TaxID=286730 RepID=UPI0004B0670B|nr:response regulator [Alkaliflexus imshenetskii]